MCLAQSHGPVPGGASGGNKISIGAGRGIKWYRLDAQALIALCLAMRCQPVIPHHAQHMLLVLLVLWECTHFTGNLGRGGVGNARHHRGDRGADSAALFAVVGMTLRHQQPANIGKTESECAIFIGQLGNFLRGELRH